MSIAINKKVKFDGARCPFSTFLRLQGDHHCACAQKWCHFSFFSRAFKQKKIKVLRPKMTKIASRGGGSCRTGTDQGQIGPLLRRGFLWGTVPADFFVLPNSSSFWSHFSAADYKTTTFSFKTLFRCAELPAKRMDSARRSARYWLRPVLSTRGEELIPADYRKEETTLPYTV